MSLLQTVFYRLHRFKQSVSCLLNWAGFSYDFYEAMVWQVPSNQMVGTSSTNISCHKLNSLVNVFN